MLSFNEDFPVGFCNNALLGDKTNYNTANKLPQFAYVASVTWANCLLMHSLDCKKPESHLVNTSCDCHSSFVLSTHSSMYQLLRRISLLVSIFICFYYKTIFHSKAAHPPKRSGALFPSERKQILS